MKKLILLSFFFVAVFLFLPNLTKADGPTYLSYRNIDSHQTWTKENSPYVVDNLYINFDLTIKPGVVVKMKPGAMITFVKKLSAVGTESDKIIFTSYKDDAFLGDTNGDGDLSLPVPGDWLGLNLYGEKSLEMILEHVGVYYGSAKGYVTGAVIVNRNNNVTVRHTDIKYSGFSGLMILEAKPILEYNVISNNNTGIMVQNSIGMVAKISSSTIADNAFGASVIGTVFNPSHRTLDATNNWWGDKTGPYYIHTYSGEDNLEGKGNKIGDGIIYDPWLGKDPNKIREPIILVPGIGASINLDVMVGGLLTDNWTMFDHTYDGIIEAFESMGYEMDKDLFICNYDWRQKNASSSVDYLEPLIKKAITLNNTSKVNIVAHSMGGLVARSYIQSDEYDNDVDNLFMIGTPNHGSSDIYSVWEGGYVPDNWDNKTLMRGYLKYLTLKYPTSSNYESIHEYVPSVKELMPIYNYTYPVGELERILDFSEMKERNDFLLELNKGIDILNERVKLSVFIGNGESTVNTIPIDFDVDGQLWIDGKPNPVDPVRNDTAGDGRVLISSALIDSLFSETLTGTHGSIVSQAEFSITLRLNEYLDVIYPAPIINDEMLIWVASPVDVEIVAPDGMTIDATQNNIPLAKYASESKPDGVKLISIPNPIAGKYEINLKGNGSGEYHLGVEYGDYRGTKKDRSDLVFGYIEKDEQTVYVIDYQPNQDGPVDDIKPKDDIPPVINAIVLGEHNENGWYSDDVIVHFEAEDNESGLDFVSQDIVLSDEGENQVVSGIAIDKAGNVATATVTGINIDKTDVNIEIGYPLLNQKYLRQETIDIVYIVHDELSGVAKTSLSMDGQVLSSTILELYRYDLGEHSLVVNAEDRAGNVSSSTIIFNIVANLETVSFDIERLEASGDITKKNIKKIVTKRIEQIVKNIDKCREKRNTEKQKNSKSLCFGFQNQKECHDYSGYKAETTSYYCGLGLAAPTVSKYDSLLKKLNHFLDKSWLSQTAYDTIKEDIDYLINNL
ncbi:MAG: hypothetical protein PF572_06880 [Patescibacteria group bacterium]|jgi:pimeloyl-ACP methyl ester carboxylesterase|nr:hypothetical protein [Patescibacteria group bacterium]